MTFILDRDDISQLRRADAIVFRFDTSEHGFSRIEGTVRPKGGTVYDDRQFEIPVNPTSVENYRGDDGPVIGGCWILHPARFIPEWATAADLLRAGDALFPHYVVGDQGLVANDAGIVVDTFDLRVHRPVGTAGRMKVLTFGLGHQLTNGHNLRNLTIGANR